MRYSILLPPGRRGAKNRADANPRSRTSSAMSIPMPDPLLEPEAYQAWLAVMAHVGGGVAEKITGRPPKEKKFCLEFQLGQCRRGSACRFAHEYNSDAKIRAMKRSRDDSSDDDRRSRRRRRSPERTRRRRSPERSRSTRDRSHR